MRIDYHLARRFCMAAAAGSHWDCHCQARGLGVAWRVMDEAQRALPSAISDGLVPSSRWPMPIRKCGKPEQHSVFNLLFRTQPFKGASRFLPGWRMLLSICETFVFPKVT